MLRGAEQRLDRLPGNKTAQTLYGLASADASWGRAAVCWFSLSRPFTGTLDGVSIGFSTRFDDPSNSEPSSIDNER
jgi:hypothetical protein